jgi:hypothetical protein
MQKRVLSVLVLCCLVSCSFTGALSENDKAGKDSSTPPAVQTENSSKKVKSEKELELVVKESQAIIKNLLQAVNETDFDKFTRDFDAGMKASYHDKKIFLKTNRDRLEKYGLAGSRPVWKIEKTNPFYNIYYLVRFSKVDKPVPVFLSLKREDGGLKIVFFQFQFSKVKK